MEKRIPLSKLIKKWQKDSKYMEAYNQLEQEYSIIDSMIKARIDAGISQRDLAKKMGTSETTISRLFSGTSLPSWKTILKFAQALGKRPIIVFVD
jgi:DNA-binding XRE family transcriptional regulator